MGKKKTTKPGSHRGFSAQQVRANAAKILKETCDKLVGSGYYNKFSKDCQARMLNDRYGAIKLSGEVDPIIEDLFRDSLQTTQVTTVTGYQLSLSSFLREGLMLIHYVEMMQNDGLKISPDLITAFSAYYPKTETYRSMLYQLIVILRRLTLICSDLSQQITTFSLDQLCAIKGLSASNKIPITTHKPEKTTITIDGRKREILRLGWPDITGELQLSSLEPSRLGFYNFGNDPYPIYIQLHALQRLAERLNVLPGLVHEGIAEALKPDAVKWQRYNEKSLVPIFIFEKKLGYLVLSCQQDCILVRSFLFLTNNGTPEGNRLTELTKLAPLDKKHLDVDNLNGFAAYNFAMDPQLSNLFIEAGCGDLLEVEHLLKFSETTLKAKNPGQLMEYLRHH